MNLRMNCIPESVKNMDFNNYSEFLEERKKLIALKIKTYYENL